MGELVLEFADVEALERECAANLLHGRGFVAGQQPGIAMLADIEVVLVHPATAERLTLPARAVMVGDSGVGFELADDGAEAIQGWLARPAPGPVIDDEDEDEPRTESGRQRAANAQARLLGLTMGQKQKLARTGEQPDRVLLERICGKAVWEPLLKNPRITIPEVARIARKGTVPRPLLELICDNNTWIRAAPVRRALLTNRRLGRDSVEKLLRAAPPQELKLIGRQTAYPAVVREAAKKLSAL